MIIQTEVDQLCIMAQNAICVLVQDFIEMYRHNDIFLENRAAQLLGLNSLMISIQHYDLTNWNNLSQDNIETIEEKLVYLSDWRI